MSREVDLDQLMPCYNHDCEGFLVRVNLPSQKEFYRCIICGKYFTGVTYTDNGTDDAIYEIIVDEI